MSSTIRTIASIAICGWSPAARSRTVVFAPRDQGALVSAVLMKRLRKALGGLFTVALLSCSPPPSPASVTSVVVPAAGHERAAQDLREKTVGLIGRDDEGKAHLTCAGVWVADKAFLSAAHCFGDEDGETPKQPVALEYVTHEGVFNPGELYPRKTLETHKGWLFALDEAHDLALVLTADMPRHRNAHVVMDSVQPGSFVHAMGHPAGFWWSYSTGVVANIWQRRINGQEALWIQATCPISPGSSGGGLFDENNNLVGITHGSFTNTQNVNIFVHSQYLRDFLVRTGVY